MATHAANDISYFLLVDEAHKSDLAAIRKWNSLKIAFDEKKIWVKDFDYVQINSVEVKSIPYKTIFYEKNGKLYLLNSLLPDRNVPALLWTPIDRALPVKLPAFNHNYFGVSEKIPVSIIPASAEMEAVAMITSIAVLEHYLQTAPAIRLQKLNWSVLNNDKALIIGKPLLPLTGKVHWMRNEHLLPAGSDFELYVLADELNKLLNPDKHFFILWNTDSTYALIEKQALQPLSLGSFRTTINDNHIYNYGK